MGDTPSQTEATGFFPNVPPSLLPRPPEVFSYLKLLFKPPKPEFSRGGAGIPEGQPRKTELTNEASISGVISGDEAGGGALLVSSSH